MLKGRCKGLQEVFGALQGGYLYIGVISEGPTGVPGGLEAFYRVSGAL